MEQSLRMMGIVRWALVASVVLYFVVSEQLNRSTSTAAPAEPTFLYGLAVIAVVSLLVAGFMRQRLVEGAEDVLRTSPDDGKALVAWRKGHLVSMAIGESVALYGVVLRVLGFQRSQTVPFFVVGILALLLFGPRRP
jgi:hypothetical protein